MFSHATILVRHLRNGISVGKFSRRSFGSIGTAANSAGFQTNTTTAGVGTKKKAGEGPGEVFGGCPYHVSKFDKRKETTLRVQNSRNIDKDATYEGFTEDESLRHLSMIQNTQKWLDRWIIGEKLCPFASKARKATRIKITKAKTADELKRDFQREVDLLVDEMKRVDSGEIESTDIETTLLVLDNEDGAITIPFLSDYFDFYKTAASLDKMLDERDLLAAGCAATSNSSSTSKTTKTKKKQKRRKSWSTTLAGCPEKINESTDNEIINDGITKADSTEITLTDKPEPLSEKLELVLFHPKAARNGYNCANYFEKDIHDMERIFGRFPYDDEDDSDDDSEDRQASLWGPNYSFRAPYPIWHLLRERDLLEIRKKHEKLAAVLPERNYEKLKAWTEKPFTEKASVQTKRTNENGDGFLGADEVLNKDVGESKEERIKSSRVCVKDVKSLVREKWEKLFQ